MKVLRLGLISLAALALGPAAHAQSLDEARLKPAWRALDKNHDGKVTLDELPPMLAMALKLHDFDKDGAISLAEYVDFDLDPNAEGHSLLPANVKMAANLPYAGTADPRQALDVYLPRQPSLRGPLPVIAYIHGGGWSTGSKMLGRNLLAKMVDGGRYAGVSIGYRLSWQATWPAQIDDAKAAIRWIRAHAKDYNFDPNRICLFGVSSGAHMAVKVGLTNGVAADEGKVGPNLKQSSRVQCVIDELGPMDLRNSGPAGAANPITQLLGGTSAEKPELARSASPILDVHAKAPPILIIAGNKDPFVPYQQSVALDEALRKAGAPVVLFQTVDGGGHGDFGAAKPVVEDRMVLFLERNFYDHSTAVPTDTLHR
ncbi:MAG: alpha/beta hydrolase fold domain-containing protein [Proteobacteria bacterium]|nr:alpha/beta hydrolase fold domain-containing protein [Pseudomonadota bacterium]